MTAQELLQYQIDDAGYQLEQVLSGFPTEALDQSNGTSISAREAIKHLSEAYAAVISESKGEKYEWGSYKPSSESLEDLMAEFRSLRTQAAETVFAQGETAYRLGSAFIVGHDYYHVGQLAAARISADPSWDPYSIYR
jgi:hypothetical protein